jgi:hypothetical protein
MHQHRYYGESFPDRKLIGPGEAWRVDQLRWLNNRQALEDSARFVRELKVGLTWATRGLRNADPVTGERSRAWRMI